MKKHLIENIAIGATIAVNRTAANVLRGGYTYNPNVNQRHLKIQGDTRIKPDCITRPRIGSEFEAFKSLLGKRIGSLTVLGLSPERAKRWVLRCDCGMFTYRAAKSIRNAIRNNIPHTCYTCDIENQKTHQKRIVAIRNFEYRTKPKQGGDEAKAMIELIGKRIGSLTVLGMSVTINSKWVVKCDCGEYLFMRAQQIRKSLKSACEKCEKKNLVTSV